MALHPTPLRRRLSDAELLRTEFRFENPEAIEGLNLGVPAPEAHPIIIGYYDETPSGGRAKNPNVPFIRCCHCGKRRHWKGHVVRDDREQLYIIGASRCGREHYGARYETAEAAFRGELARRAALRRWQNVVPLLAPVASELEAILKSPALVALELKRDEIMRASAEGFRRLVQTAGSGESLREVREERDHQAEAEREARFARAMTTYENKSPEERRWMRDEGLKPQRETDPIYVRKSTPLGPLVGGGFLTEAGDVRSAALALRGTLAAIAAIEAKGTESATLNELQRLLREMTDRPLAVQSARREVAFAPLFFEPDNLVRMERWTSSNARSSFHRNGSTLIIEDSSKGRTAIAPLTRFETDLPASPTISSMEYRDAQFEPMLAEVA